MIIPTYGAFDYASRAARSAIINTSGMAVVHVVDDASPVDWQAIRRQHFSSLANEFGVDRLSLFRYDTRGGLTRSWNHGLSAAIQGGADFVCCTNSDVLFSPGWDVRVREALGAGYHLVGPLTNAPGTEKRQGVSAHLADYVIDDAPDALARTAARLEQTYGSTVETGAVNGFCLVASAAIWSDHRYDRVHFFRPRNDFNSRGARNPTPLMTLNEYELQGRWGRSGLRSGIALGSFVFHYRAVSRGDSYRCPGWYRSS